MLPPELQKLIINLIRNGLSESLIRRHTGVSRNAIRRLLHQVQRGKTPQELLEELIKYPIPEDAPYGRCPTCGNQCYLPCKGCLTKQYNQLCEQPVETESLSESEVLSELAKMAKDAVVNTLNLKPAEQKRYEQVRRNREQAEAQLLAQSSDSQI